MTERVNHPAPIEGLSFSKTDEQEQVHWSAKAAVHAWSDEHQGYLSKMQNIAHDYLGTPTLFGESDEHAVRQSLKLSGMSPADIFQLSPQDIKGITAKDLAGVPMDKREELLYFSGFNTGSLGALINQLSPQELSQLRRPAAD